MIKNKLSKDKLFVLIDQGIVSGTTFTTGILLARMLGPSQFGVFAYAWLILMIILSFQFAFYIQPLQVLLPRFKKEEQKKYIDSVFYSLFGWSVAAGLIAGITLRFSNVTNGDLQFSLIAGAMVMIACFQDFMRRLFIIRNKPGIAMISDILYFVTQVSLVVLIYFRQPTLEFAMAAIAVSYVPSVFFGLLMLNPSRVYFGSIRTVLYENWMQAKWLLATSTLQIFTGNYFLLLAPSFLGAAALGAIRLAQNLMGVLNVILQAFDNYVPASAAKLYMLGNGQYWQYLRKISVQTGILFALLLCSIFIFSGNIFSLAGGDAYAGYSYILKGFCLMYGIMFAGYPLRIFLRLKEKTHHIFIAYIVASAFSLLAANFIIATYGITGVIAGLISVQVIVIGYLMITSFHKKIYHAYHTLYTRKG